jgi:hypothetical protein
MASGVTAVGELTGSLFLTGHAWLPLPLSTFGNQLELQSAITTLPT